MCHLVDYGCPHYSYSTLASSRHHGHCGCGQDLPPRRFPKKQEIKEELTEYLQQLKAEAKGVEERLAELGTKN